MSLSELSGGRFVALKPGHNIRVIHDRLFARAGLSPTILLETDSIEAAIRVTVACGCYMLCPQVFVRGNPAVAGEGVCYRLQELTEERHFYACYQREKYLPAYVHAFIAMAQEATRKSRESGARGAV